MYTKRRWPFRCPQFCRIVVHVNWLLARTFSIAHHLLYPSSITVPCCLKQMCATVDAFWWGATPLGGIEEWW